MSDVQTCERCGHQAYASEWVISRRTVEYVEEVEHGEDAIYGYDWTLCYDCFRELDNGRTCPFCLEPVYHDESPGDCPKNPDNTAEAGA